MCLMSFRFIILLFTFAYNAKKLVIFSFVFLFHLLYPVLGKAYKTDLLMLYTLLLFWHVTSTELISCKSPTKYLSEIREAMCFH